MEKYLVIFFTSISATLLQVGTAWAEQPICHDFFSEIEPDMQRQEADFTAENYKFSLEMLEKTIPEWMEETFKRNKKFPESSERLFQGDIWLAYANHTTMVKGYVLKLEYLVAPKHRKESARVEFCKFLNKTPIYD